MSSTINEALGAIEQGLHQLRNVLKEHPRGFFTPQTGNDTGIYVDVSGSTAGKKGQFRPDFQRRLDTLMKAMSDADIWSFGTEIQPGLVMECGGTTTYSQIPAHAVSFGYKQWIILTDCGDARS